MTISVERKEELLDKANEYARTLANIFKGIAPKSNSPGEVELRLAFDFFVAKREWRKFRQLLQLELPKRTGKITRYWKIVNQKLSIFLLNRYNEEEFAYFMGWVVRLIKYEFLLIRTSYRKLK